MTQNSKHAQFCMNVYYISPATLGNSITIYTLTMRQLAYLMYAYKRARSVLSLPPSLELVLLTRSFLFDLELPLV